MRDTLRRVVEIAGGDGTAALASVISTSGSLPMSRRSVMLVRADGTQHGTVGGGCLEAEVHSLATRVIRQGGAILGRFTLTESKAGAEGLNCGGTVRILVQEVGRGETVDVHRAACAAMEGGEETVLVTAITPAAGGTWAAREQGAHPVRVLGTALVGWSGILAGRGILKDGSLPEETTARVLDASQELIGSERSRLIEVAGPTGAGPIALFLESLTRAPVLYLFGAGHVGRAVAGVALTAGFRVVVVDDRPEFATPDRFPGAERTMVLPLRGAVGRLPVDSGSYILAVTRGHQHDEPVIEEAIATSARWIGMIGSRRKKAILWDRLKARGVTAENLERVSCPVGLPIGADSPGEIAVSIVAEMIRVRRGEPVQHRVHAGAARERRESEA